MHRIAYQNTPASREEGLPLGNGHFGGMLYLEDGVLTAALHHYDVYYRCLSQYRQPGSRKPATPRPGTSPAEVMAREAATRREPGDPDFLPYQKTTQPPETPPFYGRSPEAGVSQWPSGTLTLIPEPAFFSRCTWELELVPETAQVQFRATAGDDQLQLTLRVLTGSDVLVAEVCQSRPGLLQKAQLAVPPHRGLNLEVSALPVDPCTHALHIRPSGQEIAWHTTLCCPGDRKENFIINHKPFSRANGLQLGLDNIHGQAFEMKMLAA